MESSQIFQMEICGSVFSIFTQSTMDRPMIHRNEYNKHGTEISITWNPLVYGNPFRLTGAYEPIAWKHMSKSQKKKIHKYFSYVHPDILFLHTSFQGKKNISMPCKKYNFDSPIWLLMLLFFFLHRPHKIFLFPKRLCASTKCPDVHTKFYFKCLIY
jgi:hypothetical protein